MNLITRACIALNTRVQAFKENLKNDERGVSAIVATIILLLIVILMAAVFYEQISTYFSDMMDKIFNTNGTNAGSMNTGDFGG
ncbi:MAG: hypothetical protein IJ493_08750 [Clostridia bacterium]|nr:hypothetical protein [Clostridia bacterium]